MSVGLGGLELVLLDLDFTRRGVRLAARGNLGPELNKLEIGTSPEGSAVARLACGARSLVVVVRRNHRREAGTPCAPGDTSGDVQNVAVRIARGDIDRLATVHVDVRRPDDRDRRRTITVTTRRDRTSVGALRRGRRRRRVRAHVVMPRATIRGADILLLLAATVVAVDVVAIANHDHAAVVVYLDTNASGRRHDLTVAACLGRRVALVDAVPVRVNDLTRRALVNLSRRRRRRRRGRRKGSALHRDGVLDVRIDLRLETLRNDFDTAGDRANPDAPRDLRDHLDLDLLTRRTGDLLLGGLRLPEGEGEGFRPRNLPHRRTLVTLPKKRV